ncbi:MAG: chromate efflux transporter [bacterium]
MGITGYGGIAVFDQIKKEYVEKHTIISEKKFFSALSLAQVLPGSTIISLVSYFSYLKAGLIGAILSTIIYLLPTFVITTLLSFLYFQFNSVSSFRFLMDGLNILLIALLIRALRGMSGKVFIYENRVDYCAIIISVICFLIYFFTRQAIIYVVLLSGILGVVLYFKRHNQINTEHQHTNNKPFIIHKAAGIVLLLSIGAFALLIYFTSSTLWLLLFSFMKVGLLSFGGGIAAIPLIQNIVVYQHHWFTDTQFWDGIAISQITPGPILISTAFFGYKVGGILGGIIATIGMSIPSVLLMIMCGKIFDRISHNHTIQSIVRGFLAGFMGMLAVLILQQSMHYLVSWYAVLFCVLLLLVLRLKAGISLGITSAFVYSFLLLFSRLLFYK